MIPAGYFDCPDTPSRNSPTGRIMRGLDVIYPDKPAGESRAVAKNRIHIGGPGKVKWSRAEAQTLKDAGFLPGSKAGEK
jgi:hypothetical protein